MKNFILDLLKSFSSGFPRKSKIAKSYTKIKFQRKDPSDDVKNIKSDFDRVKKYFE